MGDERKALTLWGKPVPIDPDPYKPGEIPVELNDQLIEGARIRWKVKETCPFLCEQCGLDLHGHNPKEGEGTIIRFGNPYGMLSHHEVAGCLNVAPRLMHVYFIEVDFDRLSPEIQELFSRERETLGFWAHWNELEVIKVLDV